MIAITSFKGCSINLEKVFQFPLILHKIAHTRRIRPLKVALNEISTGETGATVKTPETRTLSLMGYIQFWAALFRNV